MKKIFILLSTALLLVGLNVKADDAKEWGDVGTPYSFGLLQDAFFIWDGGLPDGNKIIGHDDSLKNRANYLYMTKNADFPKTVTQYEATANETAKTIYLWANLVDSEGRGQNTAGYSVATKFPFIHVSAKDENGDTLAVHKYQREASKINSTLDSLHNIDLSGDTVRVFNSNHSIYYGIDISLDSRITLTWTVTYPEGHPFEGQDLTRTTVITKSADLIKNADLKILAVHQNADSALTIENTDFWDNNLLEGFDSKTFSYSVNLEDISYVRFEPALSKSTFTAKLNGKEVLQRRGAGGLEQIRVLKTGGLLEIVVTAPNKVTKQTYKITLLPPADMPDSDKKELLGERYKSAGRLLDSLYLTDGTAKYELFNDSIGAFDGFLYGTKGADTDSNTFKVSVPDIHASNLELGWHVIEDSAYAFRTKKYDFFVDKKTNASTGEVSWEVRLKHPKDDNKNADKTDEDKWDWVRLDTVGSGSGADNVVYHIKLRSNAAGIKSLVLYYDSLTATPVTLSPAFSSDIDTTYELASYVPADVKKIYLVTTTTTGNEPGFSGNFTFNKEKKPDNTYLYTVNEWTDGAVKTLAVTDTAADGVSIKQVLVELKKAYDLHLKSINISTSTGESLFSKKEKDLESTTTTEFTDRLTPGFSLDDLLGLKIEAVPASSSNGMGVGVSRSIKLTEEGYTFTFTVKSDREGDSKVYTVKLLFPKADATLDYLYTVPAGLTPEFSPEVTEYTLNAGMATSFRIITAPADKLATWSFVPVSHTDDGTFTLTQPSETFTVSVESADKSVIKKYRITVTTEGLSLAKISDSNVSVYSLNGKLNVTSPTRERVYIHSADGKLISHFDKKSGNIAVSVAIPTGIAIIKGSSGWAKKIYVK
ncbi:MAG: cadherin-like beta sandwich domain-containing protein [Dysgonamonadaceae bacterium]|jgi:hypothetical protein|nr:cadherin-like beta sandwich domain-containing protein [Dysgonamonadaceae bacterium]